MWTMLVLVFVIVLVCLVQLFSCFNIENRDPYVKKGPDSGINSYFGFSVALHMTKENSNNIANNWILVGAPKGQNLQPGTNQSGALYKCPITTADNDCIQVETDGHRTQLEGFDYGEEDDDTSSLSLPGTDEIKDGQWLGVTVKSQKPGGLVMVCAHRYIQSENLTKYHYGQGLCYLLEANLTLNEALQYCKSLPKDKLHQQYGFCQIGTSIDFPEDGFALVGSPGPYTWRGAIFAKSTIGDFLSRDKNIYKSPVSESAEPIDKYSYLGMSVGGGHFFSKDVMTYVSGAPRSLMKGQVFFLEKNTPHEELKIRMNLTGEQFASSFGYELLVVDVNNDGFDDLLVGAPFYYNDNKAGGAVYIYYNLRNCLVDPYQNCTYDKVLYGWEQSRFGFSMTSIGDINKDGYNDVAIGAPYHNDHGAVYIFLGSQNGLVPKESQLLEFPQLRPGSKLRTFGYSLSGGLDMDNNGYPDLLVGAYEAERALLFLTRPIIDIHIQIFSEDKDNFNVSKKGCAADPFNRNNTCFSVRSCFRIGGELRNTHDLSVVSNISETGKFSRIWFNDDHHKDKRSNVKRDVILVTDYKQPQCQDYVVYLKEGVSDILTPIKFTVKYSLEKDTPHSPILNTSSTTQFEATFQKNCGSDDVCESYLDLSADTNLERNTNGEYRVESLNKEFIIVANISNLRESAYEAKLFVFHPKALSFVNLQTDNTQIQCSVKNGVLVCELGNPFRANASASVRLRFQISKSPKEQKLDISLKVNSTSKELSDNTEIKMVAILQKVAEFNFVGRGTTNLFFGGKVVGESAMKHLEDIGARVVHQYHIDNRGEWDLPEIKVHIRWPYQVRPGREGAEGKWLLYLESEPKVVGVGSSFCSISEDNVVNPLGLQLLTPSSNEPENLSMLPSDLMHQQSNFSDTRRRRRRRDIEGTAAWKDIVKEGIKRKIIIMDCMENARCVDILCYIGSLKKQQAPVYVEIKSRIWNSTLVEDYSNVDWINIRSVGEISIDDSSFVTKPDQSFTYATETLVYPAAISPYSTINWWIIGIAIIAGLLLLVVLIVILYKCGFFKRKRVTKDPTLSGNLLSKDENDSLLKDK
ncbi:integrin alpha-PS1-like isoform X2 [Sitophilus oryzae]|uniref:Integrin alpha-PS1-like isoform X2 n=1 Tax=Sitophilus oryzae TaxID=7048 RepID=A0A6J2XUJ6_SITOR|nr:integrin alpha-PS1-like isoform X2 [Sitophilus oryzae]